MTNTVCTEHRDALRTRVARGALFACGGAYGCFILVVVGALSSNLENFDALLGTAVILALATPVLAAIGSFWGLGPCRIACTTVLLMTAPVVAIVLVTVLAASSN
ncbi:hypothetical protein [Tsukamurella hominis]|uniref:hypothetical protein n=1 Tax=Tsukamurella hominis TaxID=1970232 RepID=UPI0039E8644C